MLYDIIKTFKGSQDGRITETFEEGTRADLSDYLAAAVDPACIRPVKTVEVENKAVITEGGERRRGRKAVE